jgi:hypothetical protein
LNKKKNIYFNNKDNNSNNNSKICYTDRNTNINNNSKIINTEPNNPQKYINNNNNESNQSNNKLNVIKLPSKKIKEKITQKIIFPENGASSIERKRGKYICKKNLIKSNSNKAKFIPNRLSPQPKDIILKKFILSKSKIKKKNNILNNSNGLCKSSEKNVFKKTPMKASISQNTIKKKFIGLNSEKSIFINKKRTHNYITNPNNSTNIANNESICNSTNNNITMTNRTITSARNYIPPFNKISYIYQKKIK